MAQDSGYGKGLFLGFLTGGIIGSVVALLYAPKPGKELRQDIKVKSEEYLGEAETYIEQARGRAQELINDGKEKSEKLIAEAKLKVDALLNEAESIIDDAKKKSGKIVSEGKSKIVSESEKIKNAVKTGVDAYKAEKEA